MLFPSHDLEGAESYRQGINTLDAVGGVLNVATLGLGSYATEYDMDNLTAQQIASNPSDYTTTRVDDAFILPDKKQIVIPDENDVMALFKPDGIISNTLFSAKDSMRQGMSSLFNLFTSEPNPTPEPPEVDITELAKTNIVAAESYAEAMGMSLDALINKPTPPPEPTTVTDNNELVKEIIQLRKDLNQLNNRPVQVQSTINMDGNQVATALVM